MKNKIFISFFVLLLLINSCVFAADNTLSSALFVSENQYSIDSKILDNVFDISDIFEILPNANIDGNLYSISKNIKIKSDVTYSDSKSKDNEYTIDKIHSSSSVDGNAFVICNEFTLEPGCEINGDLYIIAQKINIQKSSIIHGNLFAISKDIALNGRIENSVYAMASNFSMNYYGSISKNLSLSADSVTLNSVVHKNANISSKHITSTSEFLLYGDLFVDSNSFDFSGEVNGNATINSKNLNFVKFKDDSTTTAKCLIKGDLNYSSSQELTIDDSIVKGTINYSAYQEGKANSSFNIKTFIIDLLTFIVYVLGTAFLFILLNKKYLSTKYDITVKNTFAAFGIGLLSFICVLIASILLLIANIGITLSFVLVLAYMLLVFMGIPIFIIDIAKLFKEKLNIYLSISIISLILFAITKIPYVGPFIMFVFITTGIGRIIKKLIKK